MNMTCGEATIKLLSNYGVRIVFGIPGVHTLDMCRGLTDVKKTGSMRHVQARNEQGAGFMAEGWARATGEVGVALVISGPGVTNACTALGQAYADSLPLLLISAEPDSKTIGKGWGVLHEITEQKKVTEPLTAFSATARHPADIPELFARAFSIFTSQRPRPVHISIPLDVQAEVVREDWKPLSFAKPLRAGKEQIINAANLLKLSNKPIIMIGGGAVNAGKDLLPLAEILGAVVISSTAGKGIIPDSHPLHLSGSTVRSEVQGYIRDADMILAVGTELAETDSFVERLLFKGDIIRIDIDPSKINDFYPAKMGIIGDASLAIKGLVEELKKHDGTTRFNSACAEVVKIRASIKKNLTSTERKHQKVLDILQEHVPANTIFSGDACQLVYTGAFGFNVAGPRQWFYPAGFCALGNAVPNGIGAKLAKPDKPVVVLVGDGGFMFTMPEIITAAELRLPLPIIIWENGGLKQIQDDMDNSNIKRVGVEGINPDFETLAKACHCKAIYADSDKAFVRAISEGLKVDCPTLILIKENDPWLT
ncbi:MAG: 5-guanidino-2-oxopentanoate decarboxylase [Paracoccaceae bacterium]|nr:5-guanidino-2-oxopentanoate decarboxylase [Paracoccaceae bacterium]